jgi:hypothetical protein
MNNATTAQLKPTVSFRKRVKRFLRPFVQRVLSPKSVQYVRYLEWYFSYYLVHLISPGQREPMVRRFGATLSPSIGERLQKLNLVRPTEMCRVMTKFGSDKGSNKYTTIYSALFNDRRGETLKILELGMGTNNLNVLSNMGVFGAPGASHRGWRQLFPKSLIYGADIDRGILFEEERIKTFYCNQLDKNAIDALWSHPELRDGADIIIEDGLHTFEANISFLEASLSRLRPGGIYVIEDIGWDTFERWYERLEKKYAPQFPGHEFAFVVLAERGHNNVLAIRKSENALFAPRGSQAQVSTSAASAAI